MSVPPDADGSTRNAILRWPADGILRRMLANALLLLGGKSVSGLLSLGTMALAVRALGLEHYGILVLIHTYAVTVGEISKFQSWQAILRYGTPALENGRFEDFRRLLTFTLLLDGGSAIAGTALAVGAAWFIGPLLGWPADVVPLGAVYGLSVAFAVMATPVGLLRLYDRFDLLAAQNAVESAVRLIGSGLVFLAGGGLSAFLLVWFVARGAATVVPMIGAWREVGKRHHWRADHRPGWRGLTAPFDDIWRFVWSTNLNATAHIGFTHLGTLMTGALLGPAEAGLFRIGRQLANALAKPARLMVQAIYPEYARLVAAGDMHRLRRLVGRTVGMAGLGATLGLAVLVFVGPVLLHLIGGQEAQAAYPVLLWLGAAALIDLWIFPLEPALISLGRAGTALAVRASVALVSLPVLYVLVQHLGLIGAGVATVVAALLLLCGQLLPTLHLLHRSAR